MHKWVYFLPGCNSLSKPSLKVVVRDTHRGHKTLSIQFPPPKAIPARPKVEAFRFDTDAPGHSQDQQASILEPSLHGEWSHLIKHPLADTFHFLLDYRLPTDLLGLFTQLKHAQSPMLAVRGIRLHPSDDLDFVTVNKSSFGAVTGRSKTSKKWFRGSNGTTWIAVNLEAYPLVGGKPQRGGYSYRLYTPLPTTNLMAPPRKPKRRISRPKAKRKRKRKRVVKQVDPSFRTGAGLLVSDAVEGAVLQLRLERGIQNLWVTKLALHEHFIAFSTGFGYLFGTGSLEALPNIQFALGKPLGTANGYGATDAKVAIELGGSIRAYFTPTIGMFFDYSLILNSDDDPAHLPWLGVVLRL